MDILDYASLKLIWLFLIGVLMIGFAITGGYDLGIAVLLPFLGKKDEERRLLLQSIGPTWEGNQVWLITAVGAMFAAWPFFYATAFSSLYFILLVVLLALILRPPGIDYRDKLPSTRWRAFWDWSLFSSGVFPTFLFGVAFGNVFLGVPFHFDDMLQSHYGGSFISILNPFALLSGVTSVLLFVTHGAFFIQLKTPSPLQERAKNTAKISGTVFLFLFMGILFWAIFGIAGFRILSIPHVNTNFSPLMKIVEQGMGYWGHNYQLYPLGWLIPMLSVFSIALALGFSRIDKPGLAMICNSFTIASVIATAGFTLFPFIFPSSNVPNHSLTIWDAASSQLTLLWMLLAVIVFFPIILLYTTWVFRVMRGKVSLASDSSQPY